MRLLLDTNAYSALMRGHRGVASEVRRAERILMSPIVIAELLLGFRVGSKFEENAARLEAFLEHPAVETLAITETTSDRFARVAVALRRKGTPIPTQDLWIAAQAVESGADLLSADGHFDKIDGLARVPFSPSGEDTIREQVRRYYA